MNYRTYSEYLSHPKFRAVVEEARLRSQDRCEGEVWFHYELVRCGNKATDPHHIRYCKWGEFDKVEDIQMLCRKCHENAHRCIQCGVVALKARHIKEGLEICDSCSAGFDKDD